MNKPVKYLFVDGAYFEKACSLIVEKIFPGKNVFDVIDLTRVIGECDRAFYYDALPNRSDADFDQKNSVKEALFDRINMMPNWRAHYGVTRNRSKRRGNEQKGVDVFLAIEVFQHAVNGNMDVASILAGDLDFYPLLEALVQTPVKTELIFDPSSVSKDLLYSASVLQTFHVGNIVKWVRSEHVPFCTVHSEIAFSRVALKNERQGMLKEQKFTIGYDEHKGKFAAYIGDKTVRWVCDSEIVLISSFDEYPGVSVQFAGTSNKG